MPIYDGYGIKPMAGPVGKIFAMKNRYIEESELSKTKLQPLSVSWELTPKGIENFVVCCGEQQIDYLKIIKETT